MINTEVITGKFNTSKGPIIIRFRRIPCQEEDNANPDGFL